MSQIRSKSSNPELIVRSYLHGKGFRFKVNVKNLPGKPDIVLKNTHIDKDQIMAEAVARHKKLHKDLSEDSVSKQNTQFKKLK